MLCLLGALQGTILRPHAYWVRRSAVHQNTVLLLSITLSSLQLGESSYRVIVGNCIEHKVDKLGRWLNNAFG